MLQNTRRRWKATWNPDMYHGWGKRDNYFEGWYFKIVDPTEQYAFAFIPGIALGKGQEPHAFIQMLDGKQRKVAYHNFTPQEFQPSDTSFAVSLGANSFSAQQIQLNLPEIKGILQFKKLYPWPKMLGAPGIMGWYSFVPFMECYHGVVSMNHQIAGELEVYGKKVDFTGGKGYIEKDWGRSFPSSWIWMQTNHFDAPSPVSLMASVARIPWLGTTFVGYIVGFLHEGKLYRFATYTGAQMKASIKNNTVYLSFKDRQHRLEIETERTDGGNLISPINGDMVGKVNESMQSEVKVTLYKGTTVIFEGTGRNAGMEVAGEVAAQLLTEKWRR